MIEEKIQEIINNTENSKMLKLKESIDMFIQQRFWIWYHYLQKDERCVVKNKTIFLDSGNAVNEKGIVYIDGYQHGYSSEELMDFWGELLEYDSIVESMIEDEELEDILDIIGKTYEDQLEAGTFKLGSITINKKSEGYELSVNTDKITKLSHVLKNALIEKLLEDSR